MDREYNDFYNVGNERKWDYENEFQDPSESYENISEIESFEHEFGSDLENYLDEQREHYEWDQMNEIDEPTETYKPLSDEDYELYNELAWQKLHKIRMEIPESIKESIKEMRESKSRSIYCEMMQEKILLYLEDEMTKNELAEINKMSKPFSKDDQKKIHEIRDKYKDELYG